jgi:hypothetical protein
MVRVETHRELAPASVTWGVALFDLVNDLLRKDIELIETVG